jgi:hypothetical protein
VRDPDPWILTDNGNVGADGQIQTSGIPSASRFSFDDNTEYFALSRFGISGFSSARDWLTPSYDLDLPGVPATGVGYDFYGYFWSKLGSQARVWDNAAAVSYYGAGARADRTAPPEGVWVTQDVYQFRNTTSYTGTNPADFNGPTIWFFERNVQVLSRVAASRKMVFIAQENIASNTTFGFPCSFLSNYITGGTGSEVACSIMQGFWFSNDFIQTNGGGGLTYVLGSMVANEIRFNANFSPRSNNNNFPTELIAYDPSFLYIFRSLLGEEKLIIRESTP